MNKNLVLPILVVLIIIFFFGYMASKNTTSQPVQKELPKKEETVSTYKFPGVLPEAKIKNKKAVIVTNKGTIEFELYSDKAPKTVSNFVYLAELGYYNNLSFHRVVEGFVAQGGDPTGTGAGGPGYQFEDEKVVGDYKAGTVAMANAGPNTNGSQFFICLEDLPTLPKQYNLFGQVTVGMDVVSKITVGDKMQSVTIVNK